MNARGVTTKRWESWRRSQAAVCKRRNFGQCEGCNATATEVHHVFGRRNVIGEPLASHATMTSHLCHLCHVLVTTDPACAAADRLRAAALERALRAFRLKQPSNRDQFGTARWIESATAETFANKGKS